MYGLLSIAVLLLICAAGIGLALEQERREDLARDGSAS